MIYRVNYEIKIPADKAPEGKAVFVPGVTVIQTLGAVLDVSIMPGRAVRENAEKTGKKYQVRQARAMIDTGASISVIKTEIAEDLNLIQTGFKPISSVNEQQDRPVYYGSIGFSWGKSFDTGLIACQLTNIDCLIGRDVLKYWYFNYDGTNGTIVICD